MVKIRLKRIGRKNDMTYRVVVSDSRNTPRGRNTEEIGHYDPIDQRRNDYAVVNVERALYWLNNGAKCSDSALALFKKLGIYAKFLEGKKEIVKQRNEKAAAAKKEDKKTAKKGSKKATVNKTSGKEKEKVRKDRNQTKLERIARHKAKRLEKRADKQGQAPSAEQPAEETSSN